MGNSICRIHHYWPDWILRLPSGMRNWQFRVNGKAYLHVGLLLYKGLCRASASSINECFVTKDKYQFPKLQLTVPNEPKLIQRQAYPLIRASFVSRETSSRNHFRLRASRSKPWPGYPCIQHQKKKEYNTWGGLLSARCTLSEELQEKRNPLRPSSWKYHNKPWSLVVKAPCVQLINLWSITSVNCPPPVDLEFLCILRWKPIDYIHVARTPLKYPCSY